MRLVLILTLFLTGCAAKQSWDTTTNVGANDRIMMFDGDKSAAYPSYWLKKGVKEGSLWMFTVNNLNIPTKPLLFKNTKWGYAKNRYCALVMSNIEYPENKYSTNFDKYLKSTEKLVYISKNNTSFDDNYVYDSNNKYPYSIECGDWHLWDTNRNGQITEIAGSNCKKINETECVVLFGVQKEIALGIYGRKNYADERTNSADVMYDIQADYIDIQKSLIKEKIDKQLANEQIMLDEKKKEKLAIENIENQCITFGYKKGSAKFADCMKELYVLEAKTNAEAKSSAETQARINRENQATRDALEAVRQQTEALKSQAEAAERARQADALINLGNSLMNPSQAPTNDTLTCSVADAYGTYQCD